MLVIFENGNDKTVSIDVGPSTVNGEVNAKGSHGEVKLEPGEVGVAAVTLNCFISDVPVEDIKSVEMTLICTIGGKQEKVDATLVVE